MTLAAVVFAVHAAHRLQRRVINSVAVQVASTRGAAAVGRRRNTAGSEQTSMRQARVNVLICSIHNCSNRGGSRILQERVFNPSKRGTGGRAPKVPRGVGSGQGAVSPPQKMFVFLISEWRAFMHSLCYLLTLFFSKMAL